MRIRVLLITIAIFFSTWSCEKDQERLDNYIVELATTIKTGNSYQFKLDNGDILTPEAVGDFNEQSGKRVILNYVPLNSNIIKINQVVPILTGDINTENYPDNYYSDPVKLRSVWVGGDYLNLIIEVDHHSQPHSISLLRNMESTTKDLYLSYSRNGDPAGSIRTMYTSFLITSLREETDNSPTQFTFYLNTHSGLRKIELIY